MASRLSIEPQGRSDQPRPEPGQILIVIRKWSIVVSISVETDHLLKGFNTLSAWG